jgi:hypothetical protein
MIAKKQILLAVKTVKFTLTSDLWILMRHYAPKSTLNITFLYCTKYKQKIWH